MNSVSSSLLAFVLFFYASLHYTAAYADQNDVDSLLHAMTTHSASVNTLQADFVQDKKVSFLHMPLRSQGHFFFTKNAHGSPALLWEYLSPAPSGILFQKNEGWMWLEHRAKLQKAHGYEGDVLNTMIQHMLQYFVINPQDLRQNYTMTMDTSAKASNETCMEFIPHKASFFTRMNMCVERTHYTINTLQFHEKTGDSITLSFTNTRINAPYPTAFPDGTPFP